MNKEQENKDRNPVLNSILKRISPADMAKTGDRMLIASRIDDLLKERHLSKKDFGALVGQTPPVISKWLSGTHNFTQDTLTEIRVALGVTMADLYEEKKPAVVFRAEMALKGVIAHVDTRYYGGGYPALRGVIAPEWDFIGQGNSPDIGLLTMPHHGSIDWTVLSSCKLAANTQVMRPVRLAVKHRDEDEHHISKV